MNETEKTKQLDVIEELSQKIFGKPSKDIKYLLVTNYIHKQLLDEEISRTGLYQWINVFDGEVKYPREVEDYSQYDIVQVNLSAQDVHLVNSIREQLGPDSKTMLVANNDYTTEMWGRTFEYTSAFARELQGANMLFGTEYFQVTALSELSGRKIFVIPHPADVRRLKSLPSIPKKNLITTIWRRYDNHAYIPSLVVRNHGLTTQLIGYDRTVDNKTYLTTTLYDYVLSATNFFDFCDQMRESKIVYDPFTYHSYNRAIVDCAAMGVVVVGSNRTQSINICYPHTAVDPYDVTNARIYIEKLLTDEDFYNKVVETAKEKVEFYNHTNSKERYLQALFEATKEPDIRVIKKVSRKLEKAGGQEVLVSVADDKNVVIDKNETRKNKGKIEVKI